MGIQELIRSKNGALIVSLAVSGLLVTLILPIISVHRGETSYSQFQTEFGSRELSNTELEIYSWWAASGVQGEQEALAALVDVYTSNNPGVTVTVKSDYNELFSRLVAGNPPDGFQFHCGGELFYPWTEVGYIEPLTQLWIDQGWSEKFPSDLVGLLEYEGDLYCIPLNIHRGNVLWYSQQIFSQNGLTPPFTFTEFFTLADTLQTSGIIPLALGDEGIWSTTHLMENILLGSMGPEKYKRLWNGSTRFDGPEVVTALGIFDQILDNINDDHAVLSWNEAVDLVTQEEAAMTIMGDWTSGYLKSQGLSLGVDYDWAPSPSSTGSFMVVIDSFVMPANAPNPNDAMNWLKIVASVDGQNAVSQFKGSIPARVDIDPLLYDAYQQEAIADYAVDELTPSLIHGVAAPPSFIMATGNILHEFIDTRDIEATAKIWQQAACEAGFGKCNTVFLPIISKR